MWQYDAQQHISLLKSLDLSTSIRIQSMPACDSMVAALRGTRPHCSIFVYICIISCGTMVPTLYLVLVVGHETTIGASHSIWGSQLSWVAGDYHNQTRQSWQQASMHAAACASASKYNSWPWLHLTSCSCWHIFVGKAVIKICWIIFTGTSPFYHAGFMSIVRDA